MKGKRNTRNANRLIFLLIIHLHVKAVRDACLIFILVCLRIETDTWNGKRLGKDSDRKQESKGRL